MMSASALPAHLLPLLALAAAARHPADHPKQMAFIAAATAGGVWTDELDARPEFVAANVAARLAAACKVPFPAAMDVLLRVTGNV